MKDWNSLHCYAARFADDLVVSQIRSLTKQGDTVFDPFMGSGTTLVHSLIHDRHAIGIDVDPIAYLITKVSTHSHKLRHLEDFKHVVHEHVEAIRHALRIQKIDGRTIRCGSQFSVNGFSAKIPDQREIDFWFMSSQKIVLAAICRLAEKCFRGNKRDIIKVSLSSSIIRKWPNTISLAMDIDHSRPHRIKRNMSIDHALDLFLRAFDRTIASLKAITAQRQKTQARAVLYRSDANQAIDTISPCSVDLVLTSPPYVNAIDYARAHKFAEWWLSQKRLCSNTSYMGLRAPKSQQVYEDFLRDLLPYYARQLHWLKNQHLRHYKLTCQYIYEMDSLIQKLRRILRKNGNVIFVAANNHVAGRTIQIANILKKLFYVNGFGDVSMKTREIAIARRRYPYGIRGFHSLMKREYVIRTKA